ncbi:MAG: hypothetical protein ACYS22_06675 [Planctomycetota bacterium]|jgi:hypothetical protein
MVMSRRELVLAALLFGVALLAPPGRADEVDLPSGDTLHGKVMVRQADGTVLVRLNEGGLRRLAESDYKSIRSTDPGPLAYARFHAYTDSWSRLEVLSRTFVNAAGVEVTLAGAVHIADDAFFRRVQLLLDRHDMVLFEGVGAGVPAGLASFEVPAQDVREREVAEKRAGRDKARRGRVGVPELGAVDPMTQLQLTMARHLDLTFQHEGIDYDRSFWVPADVTGEQLRSLFDNRKRSVFSEFFSASANRTSRLANRIVGQALVEAAGSVFTGKPVRIVLKEAFARLLATQMEPGPVGVPTAEEGPEETEPAEEVEVPEPETLTQEVLIQGRNRVVIEAIRDLLQNKDARRIGVFYGAAHNPDLERRLRTMGFRAVEDRWLPAWNIRAR